MTVKQSFKLREKPLEDAFPARRPAVVPAGRPAVVPAGRPAVDNPSCWDDDDELDACQLYITAQYWPETLPSFLPFERIERIDALAFKDHEGVRFAIADAQIVRCLLAMEAIGLVPRFTEEWYAQIPEDLRPDIMFAPDGFLADTASVSLPPARHQSDPALYPAQLIGFELYSGISRCRTCQAGCHCVFQTPVSQHLIEIWPIIEAMRQLTFETDVPRLPKASEATPCQTRVPRLPKVWEYQLAKDGERICKIAVSGGPR